MRGRNWKLEEKPLQKGVISIFTQFHVELALYSCLVIVSTPVILILTYIRAHSEYSHSVHGLTDNQNPRL